MDIVGPLPQSKNHNEYILTMLDRFSRFVKLVPMKDIKALDVTRAFFKYWICQFGVPEVLITDNGPQFECEVMRQVCELFGIEKRRITEYHPETNGAIERMHGTMKNILATKMEHYEDWEEGLPITEMVINTAINDRGVSPAMVLYGEQPPLPLALFKKPAAEMEIDSDGRMFVYRLSHNLRQMRKLLLKMDRTISPYHEPWQELPIKFQMVYVEVPGRHAAFQPRYKGPAIILKMKGKVLTVKYLDGSVKKVNIDRVKPVHKLRDEMADLQIPIPTRFLTRELNAGNVEDAVNVDMYEDASTEMWCSEEVPGTLAFSTEEREELLAPTRRSKKKPKKAVVISFQVSGGEEGPENSPEFSGTRLFEQTYAQPSQTQEDRTSRRVSTRPNKYRNYVMSIASDTCTYLEVLEGIRDVKCSSFTSDMQPHSARGQGRTKSAGGHQRRTESSSGSRKSSSRQSGSAQSSSTQNISQQSSSGVDGSHPDDDQSGRPVHRSARTYYGRHSGVSQSPAGRKEPTPKRHQPHPAGSGQGSSSSAGGRGAAATHQLVTTNRLSMPGFVIPKVARDQHVDYAKIANRVQVRHVMRNGQPEPVPDPRGWLPNGQLDAPRPTTSAGAVWQVQRVGDEMVYTETFRPGVVPSHVEFTRRNGQYTMLMGFQCRPTDLAELHQPAVLNIPSTMNAEQTDQLFDQTRVFDSEQLKGQPAYTTKMPHCLLGRGFYRDDHASDRYWFRIRAA